MDLLKRIDDLLDAPLEDMGYGLVRLHFGGEGRYRALQIMAERLDGGNLSIKDCTEISRTASALLDVEDWIDGRYNLEVSSPGMERPLIKLKDFERFKGRAAKVELEDAIDGQRRFKGELKGINEDDEIIMNVDGEEVLLPHRMLLKAKLVITEDLLRAIKQENKKKNQKKRKK